MIRCELCNKGGLMGLLREREYSSYLGLYDNWHRAAVKSIYSLMTTEEYLIAIEGSRTRILRIAQLLHESNAGLAVSLLAQEFEHRMIVYALPYHQMASDFFNPDFKDLL